MNIIICQTGAGVVRGYDSVSSIVNQAGLSKPDFIRFSNMRKYMATMTQVMNSFSINIKSEYRCAPTWD